MGRKKKRRLPKIGFKTILNLLGFFLLMVGIVLLASFLQLFIPTIRGRVLSQVYDQTVLQFGVLSLFLPFIVILLAGHCFNGKKLKFVRINLTVGSVVLFISLIGLFQSGTWGKQIYENLQTDFSPLGALSILIIFLIVGLVLFFDTSIDVVMAVFAKIFSPLFASFKHISLPSFAGKSNGQKDQAKQDKSELFIRDQTVLDKPKPVQVQVAPKPMITGPDSRGPADKNAFAIKPVAQSDSTTWVYPPITLLNEVKQAEADRGDVKSNAHTIEKTLDSFGIRTRVAEVNFGPTVTQYAIEITMGTKLSKITALANDLALALAAPTGQVRIEAPIPGRSLVGIEIPNITPQIVSLRQLFKEGDLAKRGGDPLLVPLGFDVAGKPLSASISKMPHILVAGTTGSGKSVMLNAWITTLMMRTRPDELRMILVDPKQVEMVQYNGSPHLLTEVINDPAKVVSALRWSVGEMEARYKELASHGARNLESFNKLPDVTPKPYIVFVIDELADLMMHAANDVEDMVTRIAQKARAVGIHLVLATQRPSVDVITGLMKANIPSRIAFNVSSMVDSRVIIDMPGAEKLLGRGDMFYLPPDQAKPRRIQGPYLTDQEVGDVVKFLRSQVPVVEYTEEITDTNPQINMIGPGGAIMPGGGSATDRDPLSELAIQLISQTDKASASLLQRKLKVGYSRAARILDQLQEEGFVGPAQGAKPREVIKEAFSSRADIV